MAGGTAAAATLSAFPPAIQRALAVPANNRTGTLRDVEHIVILTQENRSFDHYFGTLNGVRGFADRFPIPVPDAPGIEGATVWTQPNQLTGTSPKAIAPFHLNTVQNFEYMRVEGTPHSWRDAQLGWNQGKLDAWPRAKQNHSMGYFDAADLPFQFALADAFTLCDGYHCASQTGTNTNRLFLWTGTNDPFGQGNGPATYNTYDWFDADEGDGGYNWTTYPERLEAAGISWQVYENMADNFTDNSLAGFQVFRDAWFKRPGYSESLLRRGASTRDLDLLKADVLANRLPQVSWIVATAEGSEHPGPSSPAQGADYTARVLDALTANPEVWSRTVLFINFDENDGFFDHVPPPAVPSVQGWDAQRDTYTYAGKSTVETRPEYHQIIKPYLDSPDERALLLRPYGLGPRVPMYVISPWTKGGWVNSQVFDHTSTIRFIEQRFGVKEPNISAWRRTVCGDLTSAFNFADPNDTAFFAQLPATLALAERARALPDRTVPPTPENLVLPVQASGARPARALPYDLHVAAQVLHDRKRGGAVQLEFGNQGKCGAVFHVYDRLALDALPRRYTVGAHKRLRDRWAPVASGRYDLWVLGPNGFHRHVAGNLQRAERRWGASPAASLDTRRISSGVVLTLRNDGDQPCVFRVHANAYYGPEYDAEQSVMPNSQFEITRELTLSSLWYDFSVYVEGDPRFVRRFAGHVETGEPSISDPAMAGRAIGYQFRAG